MKHIGVVTEADKAANDDITLAFPLDKLTAVYLKRANTVTWSGLGATGATIATDDVAAAASGADDIGEALKKTIILTGTPAAGQVILYNKNTIHIGDAVKADDLIVVEGNEEGILPHIEGI